jgi:hypothetical protein
MNTDCVRCLNVTATSYVSSTSHRPGQALADFLDYARSEGVSNEAIKAIIAEEARPLRRK